MKRFLDNGRACHTEHWFRYSNLKKLLLKVYILTRFGGFLLIIGYHMLIG